jgi:hypothetical protein
LGLQQAHTQHASVALAHAEADFIMVEGLICIVIAAGCATPGAPWILVVDLPGRGGMLEEGKMEL